MFARLQPSGGFAFTLYGRRPRSLTIDVMLYSDVDAFRAGKPWSICGVIYGLEESIDDDGRPIYERRAPLHVKEGVPMDIRRCPYPDERYDRSMNVSALGQITRRLEPLLEDIRRFRAALPRGAATWGDAYAVVMDQLVQAAIFRLQHLSESARIPAQASVAYKMAVGFSAPMRELLVLQAQGRQPEVSSVALLRLVRERSSLVGAREACASPVTLLVRATDALLAPDVGDCEPAPPARVTVARALTQQVQLGVAWNLLDEAIEWQLLSGQHAAGALSPRTQFLARMKSERLAALSPREPASALPALPGDVDAELRAAIKNAVQALGAPRPPHSARVIGELLRAERGAVAVTPAGQAALAAAFAGYLHIHRVFVDALFALEARARQAAALLGPGEFSPHITILPKPRALPWFEMVCGYRLRCEPRPTVLYALRSTETEVPLPL